MKYHHLSFLLGFLILSCETGNLTVMADMPKSLNEISGIEKVGNSSLYWMIEDGGNEPELYGLDSLGTIKKSILIENAKNRDWEDLASDENGHLYIGDFGNNRKQRSKYQIYKIKNSDLAKISTKAEIIEFKLPKKSKQLDFEAFIIHRGFIYLFSKENGKFKTFKLANTTGEHVAQLIYEHKLEGMGNKITAADISNNGKELILLNHNKLWRLSGFDNDAFFSAKIEAYLFDHSSQKEGICFDIDAKIIVIEENRGLGNNMYSFDMNLFKPVTF